MIGRWLDCSAVLTRKRVGVVEHGEVHRAVVGRQRLPVFVEHDVLVGALAAPQRALEIGLVRVADVDEQRIDAADAVGVFAGLVAGDVFGPATLHVGGGHGAVGGQKNAEVTTGLAARGVELGEPAGVGAVVDHQGLAVFVDGLGDRVGGVIPHAALHAGEGFPVAEPGLELRRAD